MACQGFKSPQLQPRSAGLSVVDRPQIARLGQQIGINLLWKADPRPARWSRRPASLASSPGRPGPTRAGPAARYGIWRRLQAPRAMALVRLQMEWMH